MVEPFTKLAVMEKTGLNTLESQQQTLQRVTTGNIRPTLVYGSSEWAKASKTTRGRLSKSTSVQTMEKYCQLPRHDDRREEKISIPREKLQSMPSPPMH